MSSGFSCSTTRNSTTRSAAVPVGPAQAFSGNADLLSSRPRRDRHGERSVRRIDRRFAAENRALKIDRNVVTEVETAGPERAVLAERRVGQHRRAPYRQPR